MAISNIEHTVAPKIRKGPPCDVCLALDSLPPGEADGLRRLLSDPLWRYSTIAEKVRTDPDNPLDISAQSYARHARGICAARERLR